MTSIAGLNLKGRVWRLLQAPDDDQGGSVPTGMILYDPVFSRIKSEKPTLALLEQGLKPLKSFRLICPMFFTPLLEHLMFNTMTNTK
jgi:hypothetical protein